MFRMWGKLWKDNHLIKDMVACNADYSMSRTAMVFQALDEICHELKVKILFDNFTELMTILYDNLQLDIMTYVSAPDKMRNILVHKYYLRFISANDINSLFQCCWDFMIG